MNKAHNYISVKKALYFTFFLLFLFSLALYERLSFPTLQDSVQLLSNHTDDDLRKLVVKEIRGAKEEVFLSIYSLNDKYIEKELQSAIQRGVKLDLTYDPKAMQTTLPGRACTLSGLMHQKILVIDRERVWIGSTNFTTESLHMQNNLWIGFKSRKMAECILKGEGGTFDMGQHRVELFMLPKEKREAEARVIDLLQKTQERMQIAMFTWTSGSITEEVVKAHQRGVKVQTIIEKSTLRGASREIVKLLINNGIEVRKNVYSPFLHHKFALLDKRILITGSANWTKAAFSKNRECIVIIHGTLPKYKKLWNSLLALSLSLEAEKWQKQSER